VKDTAFGLRPAKRYASWKICPAGDATGSSRKGVLRLFLWTKTGIGSRIARCLGGLDDTVCQHHYRLPKPDSGFPNLEQDKEMFQE